MTPRITARFDGMYSVLGLMIISFLARVVVEVLHSIKKWVVGYVLYVTVHTVAAVRYCSCYLYTIALQPFFVMETGLRQQFLLNYT